MQQICYTERGDPLTLGSQLGRGGEGCVCELVGGGGSVAKLYHQSLGPPHLRKLQALIEKHTLELSRCCAWPYDLVKATSAPDAPAIGVVMPKATGLPIHMVYSPQDRLRRFPHATVPFLLMVATNLARAVVTVHDHEHVIGDINHDNVLVTPEGRVTLIDCDSFQITTPSEIYSCPVGVETHTPPELQGVDFARFRRTPQHDAFGLAVLIFQLLFLGRHPFAGRYTGNEGEMVLGRAMREGRFAYGRDAAQFEMEPPPYTLPFHHVPTSLQALFERAFALKRGRPTARDWVAALEAFLNRLVMCEVNGAHAYGAHLTACPWCALEQQIGTTFFSFPAWQVQQQLWQKPLVNMQLMQKVQEELAKSLLPLSADPTRSPSKEVRALCKERRSLIGRIIRGRTQDREWECRHEAVRQVLRADLAQEVFLQEQWDINRWRGEQVIAAYNALNARIDKERRVLMAHLGNGQGYQHSLHEEWLRTKQLQTLIEGVRPEFEALSEALFEVAKHIRRLKDERDRLQTHYAQVLVDMHLLDA